MSELILIQHEGAIGTITINRPDYQNALIPELLKAFCHSIDTLGEHPDIQVIQLKANGAVFSTGGDLRGFRDHLSDIGAYSKELVGLLNQAILAMIRCRVPIVTAVHGMVTGGSMGFVLASDIVLASPKASFTPYYSVVGFAPDGGWATLLPQIIGAKRSSAILMQNLTITTEKSVDWGIVHRVVDSEQLVTELQKTSELIVRHHAGSLARTKKELWRDIEEIEALLEMERQHFIEEIQTKEAQAGILDFLSGKTR